VGSFCERKKKAKRKKRKFKIKSISKCRRREERNGSVKILASMFLIKILRGSFGVPGRVG